MIEADREFERLKASWISFGSDARRQPECPNPETFWMVVKGELRPHVVRRLLDHTVQCAACAQAWRIARDVETASREPGKASVPSNTSPWPLGFEARQIWPAALAAGLMLVAFSYPAFLGLYRLPQIQRSVEQMTVESRELKDKLARSTTATESTRPMKIQFLFDPRDGIPLQTVRLEAGRAQVLLGLGVDTFGPVALDHVYRFELCTQGGSAVWFLELRGQEVQDDLGSYQGSLILPIPVIRLPSGSYKLSVDDVTTSEPQGRILSIPFVLVQ